MPGLFLYRDFNHLIFRNALFCLKDFQNYQKDLLYLDYYFSIRNHHPHFLITALKLNFLLRFNHYSNLQFLPKLMILCLGKYSANSTAFSFKYLSNWNSRMNLFSVTEKNLITETIKLIAFLNSVYSLSNYSNYLPSYYWYGIKNNFIHTILLIMNNLFLLNLHFAD